MASYLTKGLILFCNGAPIATLKWSSHFTTGTITFEMELPFCSRQHLIYLKWTLHFPSMCIEMATTMSSIQTKFIGTIYYYLKLN